jgi:hypothetical protein
MYHIHMSNVYLTSANMASIYFFTDGKGDMFRRTVSVLYLLQSSVFVVEPYMLPQHEIFLEIGKQWPQSS